MEFKEAIKIRSRMCDYYKNCDGCPLAGAPFGCVSGMAEVKTADQYERILEEWEKKQTNKFKVGDRVKVKSECGPAIGTQGVVVEIDTGSYRDGILCRFENFKGHNGNGHTRRGKDFDTPDHWYLYPHQIELISRKEKEE